MSKNYLSDLNKHPRDENIKFKAAGHIYNVKLPNSLEGDTSFTSVTTFVNSLFSKFDSDKIIGYMMASKKWSENKYYGMTKQEIKDLWSKNGQTAAQAGTDLHENIEDYYNGMNVENNSQEYSYFINFKNDFHHLKPYRTEWVIYHEEAKFTGSVDMVFQVEDGSYEIYDWKRVQEISKVSKNNEWCNSDILNVPDSKFWHYAIQLNIYKAILVEKYNIKVGNLYLVALHPNNKNYIRIQVNDLQKEIREIFLERSNYFKILNN